MFWRFGFHNTSSIDSLLDKEDVALETILDEDDLLQECKAQNTRLIDYFQRVDVLQRLFAYVTGQIEGGQEDAGQFKYPHVATEVLCSEIWSIVETCLSHRERLLVPFWETVLDSPPEEMKGHLVMASHFAKINAVFMSKKPAEMLAFIQSQPNVVERILRHVETTSFVDLLVRIIQLDEQPGGEAVLEWLSSENLMDRLVDLLSPSHSSDVQAIVADLIKGIVSMATPSPGVGIGDINNGPASNQFARQLACRESISKLAGYMLNDFGPVDLLGIPQGTAETEGEASRAPDLRSSASSVVHSLTVVTELIRKNNSDYFEPYLFHTLRNRLIQVQQHLSTSTDNRETLEQAMQGMVNRMGVVHLGTVLDVLLYQLDVLQGYLLIPRTMTGPVQTTVGAVNPLTFERFRICELFAELIHCSNMSLLNRSAEYERLYDSKGRLQGGLHALEDLANVINANADRDRDPEAMDESKDEVEPSLELPVSSSHDSLSLFDYEGEISDDDNEPGSSDEDVMEEVVMSDELSHSGISIESAITPSSSPTHSATDSEGSTHSLRRNSHARRKSSGSSRNSTISARSRSRSSPKTTRRSMHMDSSTNIPLAMPIGERLKQRFIELNILSTLLDLFFDFPWNNFLHSSVYDIIHQVLMGVVDSGQNRELVISLFRDARLMHRIVDGQKQNDAEHAKPKGLRLGYMGHLTLISENVISALDRFPPDLSTILLQYAPEPDWEDYVKGRYTETRDKDNSLLGGGKPVVSQDNMRNRWKADEEETTSAQAAADDQSGVTGEFRRATGARPTREGSADFGPPDAIEEEREDNAPQFARYLAEEMHSSDQFGSSSDDEDEDGGWLSHSTFTLRDPPALSVRQNQSGPSPMSGFDDTFNPGASSTENFSDDPFSSDEDFGQFSEAVRSGSDPFSFPASFSSDLDESSFDGFGDFGDFQAAKDDGELTPTTGSWTFEDSLSGSGSVENSPRPAPIDLRTPSSTQDFNS